MKTKTPNHIKQLGANIILENLKTENLKTENR